MAEPFKLLPDARDVQAAAARPAPWYVDADITRAHTPDKRLYTDAALFEASAEAVFARSWQWLGPTAALPAAGHVAPQAWLPGWRDEPLLLARDEAGALRCLSNVCTHRGKILVEAPGPMAQIRCGYHSRRFDLDGRLRFMPGFEGVCDFPAASDHLPQYALGDFAGQAFVALGPTPPLAEVVAPVAQRLHGLGLGLEMHRWTHDAAADREFTFDAHWALYVENYLEGLHIPFVHPGLSATLDTADYRYEQHPHATLQLALARDGQAAFTPPPGSPEHGLRVAACYWWLWPNLMLNVYPWGLSLNLVLPLTPSRTRVLFRAFVNPAADPALREQGAGGALDPVELEDEAVVLSVQRGIRARAYQRGRYAPQHEAGVHHFHRLLMAALAGHLPADR